MDSNQRVALKLAALLVNHVELAVGDAFPIGWNFWTGEREYASVTAELLQEAQGLSATLESELRRIHWFLIVDHPKGA